jgi:O-antigen biosynthesis protein
MSSPQAREPFNPLDFPLCLELPMHCNAIAWHEHIPFAFALVQALRPKTIVELGVHTGDSYLAFCQAVAAAGTDTACFGVDTWRGDAHAGYYGDEVLADLRGYHDPLYGRFSRLIQGTFDESVGYFADGSIELLQIDGLHTYEAVRHDWETWKPKLAKGGIALFHDINVRERDFGVWKLWDEVKAGRPHFEFHHGHGLGVLAAGPVTPPALAPLFSMGPEDAARTRAFFFALGNRVTLQAQARLKAEYTAALTRERDHLRAEVQQRDVLVAELTARRYEADAAREARAGEIQSLKTELSLREASPLRSLLGGRWVR